MRHGSAWKIQRHSRICQLSSHRRTSILQSLDRFESALRIQSSQSRFISTPTSHFCHRKCRHLRNGISPTLTRVDSIYLKDRASKCLQHTQALRTEGEEEEDRLEVATSHLPEKPIEAPPSVDANDVTTTKADVRDCTEPTRQISHTKSDRLLHIIEKFLPRVTPIVRFQTIPLPENANASDSIKHDCYVEIVDEANGISYGDTILPTENLQESAEEVFETLAYQYSREVPKLLKQNEFYDGSPQPYPIQKLHDLLELSPIYTRSEPIDVCSIGNAPLHLYRAQTYAGQEPLGQAQLWANPGTAERLARASADVDILRRAVQAGIDVDLIRSQSTNTRNVKKKRSYELPRVQPRDLPRQYCAPISQECLEMMLYTLRLLREQGLPDQVEIHPFEPTRTTVTPPRPWRYVIPKYKPLRPSPELQKIWKQRDQLSIRQPQTIARIRSMIKDNDVVILVSETGSGKTTQLPQLLLEDAHDQGEVSACNVLCTQPRRMAATSVAARVAQECDTHIEGYVGYHVRFDCRVPRVKGSITYMTAGILLKRLQDDAERVLTENSHIVVDEVHERDLKVDLLVAFLRDLMWKRKSSNQSFPKIVIMSATMRTTDFEQYFEEKHERYTPRVASITVSGRTYSVTPQWLDDIIPALTESYANDKQMMSLLRDGKEYLEWEDNFAALQEENVELEPQKQNDTSGQPTHREGDDDPLRNAFVPYSLMLAVAIHILRSYQQGDILIFLPGMREIDALAELLAKAPTDLDLQDSGKVRLFKLHSALSQTNANVFKPIPKGCRRIILATNIAQTSITLPDVVHVIDSGKRRKLTYDQLSRKNEFSSTWIDQATSLQRRGRAGRLTDGHYWAVFSKARFESMHKRAVPDILTSDLTTSSLVLKSHSDDIDLREFFSRAIDAPDSAIVNACIKELVDLGMLTANERITTLGKFCSEFPLLPAEARGLIIGVIFQCFTPLMLTACHDTNNPLIYAPVDRRDGYHATLEFADVSDDDRYAYIQAFREYDAAVRSGTHEEVSRLERKHIRRGVYNDMNRVARQLYEILTKQYGLFSLEELKGSGKDDSIFGLIPPICDAHSHRITIFKALALSLVNTNIAVWDEEEQSWLVKGIKCMLRPYGVNTMSSLRLLQREPLRQPGEVVGFSEMVRNALASPRPFLYETSSITPLMAMLFGGPVVAVDQQTIEIDGWLRYRIEVTSLSTQREDGFDGFDSPASIIVEFRRAFDRLMTQTVSTLKNFSWVPEMERHAFTESSRLSSSRLCSILRNQLITILEADAEHWEEKEWLKNDRSRKDR